MMPQELVSVKKSFRSEMNWVEPLRKRVYNRREDEELMTRCISRPNHRINMIVLVLGMFFVWMFFFFSIAEASGSGVFAVPDVVEEKEGETITLDFASVGVEKADWGYGQLVGEKFKVFVRDKEITKNWVFELPEKLSSKSNWEITLVVNQFEFQNIGVAVGGYYEQYLTTSAILIPLNGGKSVIRHLPPRWFGPNKQFVPKPVARLFNSGHHLKPVNMPAKLQFIYDGLDQKYMVLVNEEEVASYFFSSFENRLPWNITHIIPTVISPKHIPVRMELESKFTVRAW